MQFFTKESDMFTSLDEHSSNPNVARTTLKLECLVKIRKLQQRYLCELRLEGIKNLLSCWSPTKRHSILFQLLERCCNGAETPYKSPVESYKTKKTSNLRDHGRKWPARDDNNFCLIHLNALRCHNISKKRHTIGAKGALLKVTK
jgi:homoserine acetyltransferase